MPNRLNPDIFESLSYKSLHIGEITSESIGLARILDFALVSYESEISR